MTYDISRDRFANIYVLILSLIMIVSALFDPPREWWRVLLYVVFPVTLFILYAWKLITTRKR